MIFIHNGCELKPINCRLPSNARVAEDAALVLIIEGLNIDNLKDEELEKEILRFPSLKQIRLVMTSGAIFILFLDTSRKSVDITVKSHGLVFIGKNTFMGGVKIRCEDCNFVLIGSNSLIAEDAYIRSNDGHALVDLNNNLQINDNYRSGLIIHPNTWIGCRSTILKNSELASGSVLGAASLLVSKKIPPNTIAAGVPAKVIKSNFSFSREKKLNIEQLYREKDWNFVMDDFKNFFYKIIRNDIESKINLYLNKLL